MQEKEEQLPLLMGFTFAYLYFPKKNLEINMNTLTDYRYLMKIRNLKVENDIQAKSREGSEQSRDSKMQRHDRQRQSRLSP